MSHKKWGRQPTTSGTLQFGSDQEDEGCPARRQDAWSAERFPPAQVDVQTGVCHVAFGSTAHPPIGGLGTTRARSRRSGDPAAEKRHPAKQRAATKPGPPPRDLAKEADKEPRWRGMVRFEPLPPGLCPLSSSLAESPSPFAPLSSRYGVWLSDEKISKLFALRQEGGGGPRPKGNQEGPEGKLTSIQNRLLPRINDPFSKRFQKKKDDASTAAAALPPIDRPPPTPLDLKSPLDKRQRMELPSPTSTTQVSIGIPRAADHHRRDD